jgi:hypothetical protein
MNFDASETKTVGDFIYLCAGESLGICEEG